MLKNKLSILAFLATLFVNQSAFASLEACLQAAMEKIAATSPPPHRIIYVGSLLNALTTEEVVAGFDRLSESKRAEILRALCKYTAPVTVDVGTDTSLDRMAPIAAAVGARRPDDNDNIAAIPHGTSVAASRAGLEDDISRD